MHKCYLATCSICLALQHTLSHRRGGIQRWPQSTLDADKIFGGKDLIEVWSSVTAQMHGYKLGVGAVILLDEEF